MVPYDADVPHGGDFVTTYGHSDAGRLILVEDALGQQTRYTWASGVLTGEEVDGLILRRLNSASDYRQLVEESTVGVDGGGAALPSSPTRRRTFSYDPLGRLTDAETSLDDGTLGADSIASRYRDFDSLGTPRINTPGCAGRGQRHGDDR